MWRLLMALESSCLKSHNFCLCVSMDEGGRGRGRLWGTGGQEVLADIRVSGGLVMNGRFSHSVWEGKK